MNQKAIIGFINIFIIVVVILYFAKELFTYKGPDIVIHIEKGMKRTEIAKLLEEKGVIPDASLFLIYTEAKGTNLKYGYYLIKNGYTIYDIWKVIHDGKEYLFPFTIKPGDDLIKIGIRLEKEGFIKDRLDFYKFVFDDNKVFSYGLDGITFEGYFPPETYKLSKTKTRESIRYIVEAFLKEFNTKYKPYKQKVGIRFKKLGLAFYDVMIIASMVEKETPKEDEKPLIAGVIIKRIKEGTMRLQIDPTTIYSIRLKRLIMTYPDVFKNFPIYEKYAEYDTYRYWGLPPTPICSFTLSTLEATLNYTNEEGYRFYFSPNGYNHIFSKTYKEHLRKLKESRRKK